MSAARRDARATRDCDGAEINSELLKVTIPAASFWRRRNHVNAPERILAHSSFEAQAAEPRYFIDALESQTM